MDGVESARSPMHWRHSLTYNPVDQPTALLCGQLVTVVPPKLYISAGDKSEPRGEERVFLCYFEKHGYMDGSILTISLKAALTGGQLYMHRTRDFRTPSSISFPLRQARDWQLCLKSAKLWTQASSQQLRDEIDKMIEQGKSYKPAIIFETLRSIREAAAATTTWEPAISESLEEAPSKIADAEVPVELADASEDLYCPSGGESDDDIAPESPGDSSAEAAPSGPEKNEIEHADEAAPSEPAISKIEHADAAAPSELEKKEVELRDKQAELERLSQYGGSFHASGKPVRLRPSTRPRDQLPEFWDLATENQKKYRERFSFKTGKTTNRH